MSEKLTYTRVLTAPPSVVFEAFTQPVMLRQWMCDQASIVEGARTQYAFVWRVGFHAVGEYRERKPDQRVVFTWWGTGDPGSSLAEVELTPDGDGTRVDITHSGFGDDPAWTEAIPGIDQGWRDGLDSLAYLLEYGVDRRLYTRPMLGIYPSELTPEDAARRGLSAQHGIYLDGVVDGMSAQNAGMQSGDVVVAVGGKPVTNYGSLTAALAGLQGGDVVEVEYVRGAETVKTQMPLSKRPMPDVPAARAGLIARIQTLNSALFEELDAILDGATEAEFQQSPAPDEWSAFETLAHITFTQANLQRLAWSILGGTDDLPWHDNHPLHTLSIRAMHPTMVAMVAAYKAVENAMITTIEGLPEGIEQNKPKYILIAHQILEMSNHTHEHFAQMRAAIAAARGEMVAG